MKNKTDAKIKTAKQMERHFKGIANHRRIDIILLIAQSNGITVEQISKGLDCNFKTVSEHTHRLYRAGLINKEYRGRTVVNTLSPYGKTIYKFIETFRHS